MSSRYGGTPCPSSLRDFLRRDLPWFVWIVVVLPLLAGWWLGWGS